MRDGKRGGEDRIRVILWNGKGPVDKVDINFSFQLGAILAQIVNRAEKRFLISLESDFNIRRETFSRDFEIR